MHSSPPAAQLERARPCLCFTLPGRWEPRGPAAAPMALSELEGREAVTRRGNRSLSGWRGRPGDSLGAISPRGLPGHRSGLRGRGCSRCAHGAFPALLPLPALLEVPVGRGAAWPCHSRTGLGGSGAPALLAPQQAGQGDSRALDTLRAGHGGTRSISCSRAGVGLTPGAFPPAGKSMVSEQTDKVQAAKVGRGRFRLTTEEKRDSSH